MADSQIKLLRLQRNLAFGIAAVCLLGLVLEIAMHEANEAPAAGESSAPESSQSEDEPSAAPLETTTEIGRDSPVATIQPAPPGEAPPDEESSEPAVPDTLQEDTGGDDSPLEEYFSREHWQDHPYYVNEAFMGEVRDEQWADAAEIRIRDFIARHPYAYAYENVWLECRASLCQVYAALESSMAEAMQSTGGNMNPFTTMSLEPLGGDLEMASSSFGVAEPGRLDMVVTLRRRE